MIAFFISRWHFTLPVFSLSACLLTLVLMVSQPAVGAFSDAERFDPVPVDPAATEAAQAIFYDEAAADPFQNTIRTDVFTLQLMQELHPGLGLHYGWFTTETTGRSRWILTDHLKCPVTDYQSVLDHSRYRLYQKIEENVE